MTFICRKCNRISLQSSTTVLKMFTGTTIIDQVSVIYKKHFLIVFFVIDLVRTVDISYTIRTKSIMYYILYINNE